MRRFDVKEVCDFHIVEGKGRPQVCFYITDRDIVQLDPSDMADKKAIGRNLAKHRGLGIIRFSLRGLKHSLFSGAIALVVDRNVTQLHVFDVVTGDAADNGGVARVDIIGNDIADMYASQLAHGGTCRSAHAAAQSQEERGGHDVAHGDVGDGDVFENGAVNGFQRQPATMVEQDIRDGYVFKAAV